MSKAARRESDEVFHGEVLGDGGVVVDAAATVIEDPGSPSRVFVLLGSISLSPQPEAIGEFEPSAFPEVLLTARSAMASSGLLLSDGRLACRGRGPRGRVVLAVQVKPLDRQRVQGWSTSLSHFVLF